MSRRLLAVGAGACLLMLLALALLFVLDGRRDGGTTPLADTREPGTATGPGPALSPTPAAARVFPVPGEVSYAQTHHGYPATDIMAPCGVPYLAPYSGVVHEVNPVDAFNPAVNDGASRGGLSVAILGDDGVRYYGSHFQAIAEGIEPGVRVDAGDPVATVGETGDASACHVHFGLSPVCGDGDWFVRRGVIWPWPYLDSWRSGGNADPGPEIQQWLATQGCPAAPAVEP